MIAPRPCGGTGTIGTWGSADGLCDSPGGGSGALDEAGWESAGESPATKGTLGSDGGSGGGSPVFFGEAAGLPNTGTDPAGSADAPTGDGVGLSLPESPVFAGAAAGSLGRDAGLAVSADGIIRSDTVVGSAGAGAGAGVRRAGGVGRSNAAGVNAIGGSKRAKVLNMKGSVQKPVHSDAHVGLRENISIGGTMSGSHGGPIVVIMLPLADVLNPKPHVGHARS